MPRPDEGLIHAWLDGELEPAEAARVQKLADSDPEWMAAVAEARGLIAASSRIVRALDAVPGGVMPARTARVPMAQRGFRVRPWMGIAAGLVLVVGTAYVMRESTQEAFGPTADVGASVPAETAVPQAATAAPVPPTAPAAAATPTVSGERREVVGPPRDQPVGPLGRTADDARRDAAGAGSTGASAPAPAPAPVLPPPPRATAQSLTPNAPPPAAAPAPTAKVAAEEDRSVARLRAGSDRLSQVVVTGVTEAERPAYTLVGCWRATAPDSLVALYRDLVIVRTAGDTLEVVLPNARTVVVIRDRDTLRGGFTAVREACPTQP